MGFADMLLYMGIPYNSDAGVSMAKTVMELVQTIGHQESQRLAETRGAFPLFAESVYRDGTPLRNATVTTIAPTGTLSIIAGVSSGVEPVFAYAYIRNVMDNTHLIETNQILKDPGPCPRRSGGYPPDFCLRPRRLPHLACENAGRVPGVHRQRGLQDGELPQFRHPGRGRRGLPPGL